MTLPNKRTNDNIQIMTQRSVKRKGALHSVPKFYACYLLRSIPKPNSFYIGSTPDPVRRLRQHNGELTAGAFKTKKKGYRPWEMLMVVHGFPNKIAVLQFEHAWQHSYQTRHIDPDQRITKSKTAGRSLAHKLGNIRLLLNANYFCRMNLKLQLFSTEIYKVWCANKFGITLRNDLINVLYDDVPSGNAELNFISVQDFKQNQIEQDKTLVEKFNNVIKEGEAQCNICSGTIDYIKDDSFPLVSICYHEGCSSLTHLNCLYKDFRNYQQVIPIKKSRATRHDIDESDLIPVKGKCSGCGKALIWTIIVRNSTMIRMEIGYDGKIHLSQIDALSDSQIESCAQFQPLGEDK